MIDAELNALKALNMLIEMRIKTLEEYKEGVKKERKERVEVD